MSDTWTPSHSSSNLSTRVDRDRSPSQKVYSSQAELLFPSQSGGEIGLWGDEGQTETRQERVEDSNAHISTRSQSEISSVTNGATNNKARRTPEVIDLSGIPSPDRSSPHGSSRHGSFLFTPEPSPEPQPLEISMAENTQDSSESMEKDVWKSLNPRKFVPNVKRTFLSHVSVPSFPDDSTPAHYFKPHPNDLAKLQHAYPSVLFRDSSPPSKSRFGPSEPSSSRLQKLSSSSRLKKAKVVTSHSRGTMSYTNIEDAMNASTMHNASEDYNSFADILTEMSGRGRKRVKDNDYSPNPRKKIRKSAPPPANGSFASPSSTTKGNKPNSKVLQTKKEPLSPSRTQLSHLPNLGSVFTPSKGDVKEDRVRLYVGRRKDLGPGRSRSSSTNPKRFARISNIRFVKEGCKRAAQSQVLRRPGLPSFLNLAFASTSQSNGLALRLELGGAYATARKQFVEYWVSESSDDDDDEYDEDKEVEEEDADIIGVDKDQDEENTANISDRLSNEGNTLNRIISADDYIDENHEVPVHAVPTVSSSSPTSSTTLHSDRSQSTSKPSSVHVPPHPRFPDPSSVPAINRGSSRPKSRPSNAGTTKPSALIPIAPAPGRTSGPYSGHVPSAHQASVSVMWSPSFPTSSSLANLVSRSTSSAIHTHDLPLVPLTVPNTTSSGHSVSSSAESNLSMQPQSLIHPLPIILAPAASLFEESASSSPTGKVWASPETEINKQKNSDNGSHNKTDSFTVSGKSLGKRRSLNRDPPESEGRGGDIAPVSTASGTHKPKYRRLNFEEGASGDVVLMSHKTAGIPPTPRDISLSDVYHASESISSFSHRNSQENEDTSISMPLANTSQSTYVPYSSSSTHSSLYALPPNLKATSTSLMSAILPTTMPLPSIQKFNHIATQFSRKESLNDTNRPLLGQLIYNSSIPFQPSASAAASPSSSAIGSGESADTGPALQPHASASNNTDPNHDYLLLSTTDSMERIESSAVPPLLTTNAIRQDQADEWIVPHLTQEKLDFDVRHQNEMIGQDSAIDESGIIDVSTSDSDRCCSELKSGANSGPIVPTTAPDTINPSVLIGTGGMASSQETKQVYYSGELLPHHSQQRIITVLPKSQKPPRSKSRPNSEQKASQSVPEYQARSLFSPSSPRDLLKTVDGSDSECHPQLVEGSKRKLVKLDLGVHRNEGENGRNDASADILYRRSSPARSDFKSTHLILPSSPNSGLQMQTPGESLTDADIGGRNDDARYIARSRLGSPGKTIPTSLDPRSHLKTQPKWPTGPKSYFCHQCRRTSFRLHMVCSSDRCSLSYCVRCVTLRYANLIEFNASKTDFVCFRCTNDGCICDHCCRRRGVPYISLKKVTPADCLSETSVSRMRVPRKVKVRTSKTRVREEETEIDEKEDRMRIPRKVKVRTPKTRVREEETEIDEQEDTKPQRDVNLNRKMVWPCGPTEEWCHQCRTKSYRLYMECSLPACSLKYCVRCITNKYSEETGFNASQTDFVCFRCKDLCRCTLCDTQGDESSVPPKPFAPIKIDAQVSEPVIYWGAVYNENGEAIAAAYVTSMDKDDVFYARPFPPRRRIFVGDVQPEWQLGETVRFRVLGELGKKSENEGSAAPDPDTDPSDRNVTRRKISYVGKPPPRMSAILHSATPVGPLNVVDSDSAEDELLSVFVDHSQFSADDGKEAHPEQTLKDNAAVDIGPRSAPAYESPFSSELFEVDRETSALSMNEGEMESRDSDDMEDMTQNAPQAGTEAIMFSNSPDAESFVESATGELSAIQAPEPIEIMDDMSGDPSCIELVDSPKSLSKFGAAGDASEPDSTLENAIITDWFSATVSDDACTVTAPQNQPISSPSSPSGLLDTPSRTEEKHDPFAFADHIVEVPNSFPHQESPVLGSLMDFGSPLTELDDDD
ncbi:hypothetical protein GYMLUDRAFT_257178 [Collybiopsis luxurians FD-317 M1]|nr:hypothetical protein GYMLUDRAFT_257178 [Collybiopsis luxurians FD-317 M1]